MSVSKASSPESGTIPAVEAAAFLGITPKTLANWRSDGCGPRFVRFGATHSRVYYRIVDLEAFVNSHVVGGDRS